MAARGLPAAWRRPPDPPPEEGTFMEAQDVPGDGRCLFHAVAAQAAMTTRALLDAYLRFLGTSCPALEWDGCRASEWIVNSKGPAYKVRPCERYAAYIRQPGAWGSGLDLFLLAHMLQRPIHVYQPAAGGQACRRTAWMMESLRTPPILLLFVHGNHYQVLHWRRPAAA